MRNTKDLLSPEGRFESLDVFRGWIMLLLFAEGFGLTYFHEEGGYWILSLLGMHFTHHEWHGMYFWDLVQPFFMFIVGVAMPFSFAKRWERGDSWGKTFEHVIKRSLLLLALGILLKCRSGPNFQLWNVLCQLSFTYLVAFLMMRTALKTQLGFTVFLMVITYLAYRFIHPVGFGQVFDQPWEPDKNLGSFMDMVLVGKLSEGHWITINCIPTTAHTMWGVMCGQILRSGRTPQQVMKVLAIAGIAGLIIGLALDPITPIVKRICTSSFVIFSGGWCVLALLFFFWLVDVKGVKKPVRFLTIVGMNSLFIYLFDNTLHGFLSNFVEIFSGPTILATMGIWGKFIHWNILVFIEWYLCYWLYKNRTFIRI